MLEQPSSVEVESLRLQKMRDVIAGARNKVEEEFERTPGNSWPACLNTIASVMAGHFFFLKQEKDYTPQKYAVLESNFAKFIERLDLVRVEYPRHENTPSAEVKEELFRLLNIFE